MKQPLRIFPAVCMFAAILAGCMTILMLLILMARFPLLLIAIALACWIHRKLQGRTVPSSQ